MPPGGGSPLAPLVVCLVAATSVAPPRSSHFWLMAQVDGTRTWPGSGSTGAGRRARGVWQIHLPKDTSAAAVAAVDIYDERQRRRLNSTWLGPKLKLKLKLAQGRRRRGRESGADGTDGLRAFPVKAFIFFLLLFAPNMRSVLAWPGPAWPGLHPKWYVA